MWTDHGAQISVPCGFLELAPSQFFWSPPPPTETTGRHYFYGCSHLRNSQGKSPVPAAAPVISAAALRQPQGCRQRGAPVLPSSGAEAPRVLLLLPCASRRCSPGAFLAILVALCLKHFSHAERQGLGRVLFPFIREAEKVSKRVIFYSNSCCGMK